MMSLLLLLVVVVAVVVLVVVLVVVVVVVVVEVVVVEVVVVVVLLTMSLLLLLLLLFKTDIFLVMFSSFTAGFLSNIGAAVVVSFSGVKVVESGSSKPFGFILAVFGPGYLAMGCRGGSCPTVPANGFASLRTAQNE
jgi:hypothetical protein